MKVDLSIYRLKPLLIYILRSLIKLLIGIRDNSYSSSYGMIKYFIEKLKLRGREYTMFNEDKEYKLVEGRKNNEGFSFGKFFEYFFNNKED